MRPGIPSCAACGRPLAYECDRVTVTLRGHTDARRAAGITPPQGELPAGWPRSASMKEAT